MGSEVDFYSSGKGMLNKDGMTAAFRRRISMGNGGEIAQRGFIFQSIIAMIECLERDDWTEIKMEPDTKDDKVDIMLYKDGDILSAIQVKSSKNPFRKNNVQKWLEKLKKDAIGTGEVCLCLVGDSFHPDCEEFIKDNPEVKTVSFLNLQNICTEKLINYIKNNGLTGEVRGDDLELLDNHIFAKIHKNSIAKEPISRTVFEVAFRKAMPVHMIPLCLTPIPAINQEVGLIGRDEVKREIRNALEKNSCTALVNGIGGIGKTAVMQHICNDVRNEGKYVAWIECSDSLQDDLLLLRTALGIPETDGADDAYEKVINEIRSRLSGKLYLFMDNLSRTLNEDEQRVLNGLGIHVMATSRFEHEYFVNLPLDILEKQDAIDMFYGYYRSDRERRYENTAWKIIDAVHSHTLLVELVAKAAWEEGGTLESFYNVLQEQGFLDVSTEEVWTKHDSKERTIEESIIKLYEISELPEIQQHIMRLFTIFTPGKEIFYRVRDWGGLDRQGIRKLILLGWLSKGGIENGYKIHQVVRDSIAKQIERSGEEVKLEDYGELYNKVKNTDNYLSGTVTYEFVRERITLTEDVARFLSKKTKACLNYLTKDKDKQLVVDTSVLINNMAGVYDSQGDYDKAIKNYSEALILSECVLGKEHSLTVTIINNMALSFRAQGDYAKALEYYEKALDISERNFGIEHAKTATVYNNIALVCLDLGDYDKSMEYCKKALTIRENVLGTEHPDTAATYNNIAMLYDAQGKYDKALEYYLKDLVICEQVLGTEHPDTAKTYNNMAVVYENKGNYDKSLEFYKKALVINERVLGTEHPEMVSTYNNIAGAYYLQDNYPMALEYYTKAVNISEHVLGMEHPDTALMYNNIALIFQDQCNYTKAFEYFRKALSIVKKVFGTSHLYAAAMYNNIGAVYEEQGKYEKALEYYNKNLSISESLLGTEHPDLATAYNNIAGVLRVWGEYEKALEYYEKDIAINERVLGTDHPDTATTYNNIAGVYEELGNYTKALIFYEKALAIREHVLGKECRDTATTYNNMAVVYEDQGDFEKAMEYYEKARTIREHVLGTEHPDTATTYNNIARVFREQGEFKIALKYHKKALVIYESVLGKGHLSTASTYNNLGLVYEDQGKYTKALEYYNKALDVYFSVVGEKNPLTQKVIENRDYLLQLMDT